MNNKPLPLFLLITAFLGCLPGLMYSKSYPHPALADPRIRTENYSSQNVSTIKTALGYVTTIEFSPDETIEDAIFGVNAAWDAQVKGHTLYIKAVAPQQEGITEAELWAKRFWDTNLTVRTDKHLYVFDLVATKPEKVKSTYFVVYFNYPETHKARTRAMKMANEQKADKALIKSELNRFKAAVNWNYSAQMSPGAEDIAPAFVYDDGFNTYLGFSQKASIPAVFKYLGPKKEMIVNTSISPYNKNYKVLRINQLGRIFVLRQDNKVVAVYNQSFDNRPSEYKKTDSQRIERVLK